MPRYGPHAAAYPFCELNVPHPSVFGAFIPRAEHAQMPHRRNRPGQHSTSQACLDVAGREFRMLPGRRTTAIGYRQRWPRAEVRGQGPMERAGQNLEGGWGRVLEAIIARWLGGEPRILRPPPNTPRDHNRPNVLDSSTALERGPRFVPNLSTAAYPPQRGVCLPMGGLRAIGTRRSEDPEYQTIPIGRTGSPRGVFPMFLALSALTDASEAGASGAGEPPRAVHSHRWGPWGSENRQNYLRQMS